MRKSKRIHRFFIFRKTRQHQGFVKKGLMKMGKELSEMTLEELWELFPIFPVPHNDKWSEYYDEIE